MYYPDLFSHFSSFLISYTSLFFILIKPAKLTFITAKYESEKTLELHLRSSFLTLQHTTLRRVKLDFVV